MDIYFGFLYILHTVIFMQQKQQKVLEAIKASNIVDISRKNTFQ